MRDVTENYTSLISSIEEGNKKLDSLNGNIIEADAQRRLAEQKRASAIELADKEIELEVTRRKDEALRKLAEDIENLNKNSQLPILQEQLDKVNNEIEEGRKKLLAQQELITHAALEEDFVNYHSIAISDADLRDIDLIREFEPRLNRQEAFRKLVWTEFIQKPIQALCKQVKAEKVTGIYKITNTKNGRMYIGQAVDIAARWKEHCKTALGIGATSYMTNKFYKAMHDEGIENFTFEVLEVVPSTQLGEREYYWIDFCNATTFGYNTKIGG